MKCIYFIFLIFDYQNSCIFFDTSRCWYHQAGWLITGRREQEKYLHAHNKLDQPLRGKSPYIG